MIPPGEIPTSILIEEGREYVQSVARLTGAFLHERAEEVVRAGQRMAVRFHAGGRLLVFGVGPSRTDAYHVAGEFVQPLIQGRPSLPAVALEPHLRRSLRLLGRPRDIAMGISATGYDLEVADALAASRARGMLTVGLSGGEGGRLARAEPDHLFRVTPGDPTAVQEVHRILYHLLWEVVHRILEHPDLLAMEEKRA